MKTVCVCVLMTVAVLASRPVSGYSVLSHEELVDIAWDSDIQPALIKRFPQATPEQLQKAHAYAYGGSVVQDLGYYPFGSHEFTNLLHYVRSGDFVTWMLRDARDINEFAFALGALSHYAADTWGHPAVNLGVGLEYPKLRAKYGDVITFEDDPEAHLRTEFSFDVVQVAKQRYTSKQYHDFIGFQVSESLLERAFADTYGVALDDFLHVDDLTLATYRFSVSKLIPEMTQVALATRKHQILGERHDRARKEFLYHLSRADYQREYGSKYQRPGVFARIVAFLLKLVPKFGSFRVLGYRDPTPETEDLYMKSMNTVIQQYHNLLQQVKEGEFRFPNRNLDTGELARAGRYWLTDETYSAMLRRLAKNNFAHATPALKANVLQYFASGSAVQALKGRKRRETEAALAALKSDVTRRKATVQSQRQEPVPPAR